MNQKLVRSILVYAFFLIIFGLGIFVSLDLGKSLETNLLPSVNGGSERLVPPLEILSELGKNLKQPVAMLILQLLVILGTARVLGSLLAFLGQPSVIGEIIAGILLGPSFLGMFWPEASDFLFPKESLKIIQALSNVGLLLFLFLIGMELNLSVLGKKAHDAVVVSHASILFPFFLGTAYSLTLYGDLAPKGISFLVFGLFMGIAMSITAFPVLARIVQERGLTKTPLGTLVITCAAADDITAWCILAGVVAIAQAGTFAGSIATLGLAVIYVIIMILAVRPLMRKISSIYPSKEALRRPVTAFVFMIWLLSAYATEAIGIHALFGAFFAGVIMPPQLEFRRMLSEKIEDVSLLLLLPLFFVSTGLKTQIGLLSSGNLWWICFGVIGIAIVGKFLGSAVAAKLVGQSWKDSLAIGALMNTRGLMELVVLNIGYDLGILSKEIFAMMVLMALVTTFMTGPILDILDLRFFSRIAESPTAKRKILLSFAAPSSGVRLLELVSYLFPETKKKNPDTEITALHVTSSGDLTPTEAETIEKEVFSSLEEKGRELGWGFKRIYKNTSLVAKEILNQTRQVRPNLLLIGRAHSIFSKKDTVGRVRFIVENSPFPVGILIDRGFKDARRLLFLFSGNRDAFLREYFEFFSNLSGKESTILWTDGLAPKWATSLPKKSSRYRVKLLQKPESELTQEDWTHYDLIIASWDYYREIESTELASQLPSILILTS
ncbi:transporter, CPA2 family [Leptospira broomii serovar Hurstbridge str. 5399]|uniref:Transporter, CPA2 family n=1 Tax=Leptospira broomii serovar Hurstbridge str. 5399 TaxID=1049789 RepID=T0GE69_9LEPT|nr:cation:proton antiporter [Leptospira broomii]EQA45099.1 transporter, CPA2 family [Leptospira broomii serovar Hurstbridge str. 5399]